jgi:protein-disulfide isomerase
MTTPMRVLEARLVEPLMSDDHLRGAPGAPVVLVEYGDFQCPYCRAAHPVVQELLRQRPQTVLFAFRHFPLTNVHPYAELAAEVSESAGTKELFWAMHDWLFEHQEQITPDGLLAGAESVGLRGDTVDREVSEHVWADRVRRDFVSGIRSGVNGTPTFYVNGVRHDLANDLPTLLAAVDEAAGSV